jgi:predicted RNase H-like HicB family nuclease
MKYTVVVQEDLQDGGYFAYVPELKGCFTQADTLDELRTSIIEAVEATTDETTTTNMPKLFGILEMEIDNAIIANY